MNIYFFIKDISLTGGTERVTVNLANLFKGEDHNVTIVSYYHGKREITYKPNVGVDVRYLIEDRCPDEGKWLTRFNFFIKSIKSIKNFFKENKIGGNDVIISQNFFSNTLIWLSGKAKYAVGCEHFKYELYPPIVRGFRCFVYKHFKQIITLTEKDRTRFCEHLPENKVRTIPNMVLAKEGFGPDHNSKSMIAVGRLDPQKGFDMLIEAMVCVHKKHPDWTLNIFGVGDYKEKLQSQIDNSQLKNTVYLKGYTTDLNSEFARSAFFILSSRFEGFPLVLIEALGQGMPAVAFDCPEGPAQLLEKGGGILVPKEDVQKLSDAICTMIENPAFRVECENHKDIIKKELSPESIYALWSDVFRLKCQ